MGAEQRSQANGKALAKALQALPVLDDDPYLRMQAFNLGLVDDFLMDVERQLLQEYIAIERTPTRRPVLHVSWPQRQSSALAAAKSERQSRTRLAGRTSETRRIGRSALR